jgi:hypothetical protein
MLVALGGWKTLFMVDMREICHFTGYFNYNGVANFLIRRQIAKV